MPSGHLKIGGGAKIQQGSGKLGLLRFLVGLRGLGLRGLGRIRLPLAVIVHVAGDVAIEDVVGTNELCGHDPLLVHLGVAFINNIY